VSYFGTPFVALKTFLNHLLNKAAPRRNILRESVFLDDFLFPLDDCILNKKKSSHKFFVHYFTVKMVDDSPDVIFVLFLGS
jgi:hypothetical protein